MILAWGVAVLLCGLFGDPATPLAVVGLGVLLVFFGVSVLGRTVALPLSRSIGAPLPRLRGITGELARENAMRNPKRTARRVGAHDRRRPGGLHHDLRRVDQGVVQHAVDRAFTGDLGRRLRAAASAASTRSSPQVNELPEVDAGGASGRSGRDRRQRDRQVLAADPATAFDVFDVDPSRARRTTSDATSIAVFEDVAEDDKGLSIGDTVPVVFTGPGPQELTVAMIYGEGRSRPATGSSGIDAYEANFADQYDSRSS